MDFKSVKILIYPLIKSGQEWQNITINGEIIRNRLYFSNIQWAALFISIIVLLRLESGLGETIIGFIISALSISVSLLMSLLVSIFDKFQSTNFTLENITENEKARLIQKKNYFKRFISITSYLVVLSIFIIIFCAMTYIFNLENIKVEFKQLTLDLDIINWNLTYKNTIVVIYRIILNYFLLNYLILTLFIAGSSYEYYMSEMNQKTIE